MSSTPTSELNDADCEKGHVCQRPPISYALSKDETSMKASRETIKMKTPEGKVKVAVLGDSPGAEEYLQHINNFIRMLERKKIEDDLLKFAKAVISPRALVRKLKTALPGEKPADKTVRLEQLEAVIRKLVEAEVSEEAKLEPKISGTRKKSGTGFLTSSTSLPKKHKHHTARTTSENGRNATVSLPPP
jgi:hypothetical protein